MRPILSPVSKQQCDGLHVSYMGELRCAVVVRESKQLLRMAVQSRNGEQLQAHASPKQQRELAPPGKAWGFSRITVAMTQRV